MEEKKLTAKERRERNFYDAQYMIYYELPVLISKIFHAAFANCECGTPVIEKEDICAERHIYTKRGKIIYK